MPMRSNPLSADRSTTKVVLALILVVFVPYLLLHHLYLALQRTVAGVTRASVSVVVADYNEVNGANPRPFFLLTLGLFH
jgi:hypothetical protein